MFIKSFIIGFISLILGISSCEESVGNSVEFSLNDNKNLILISVFDIDVEEPSGLAIDDASGFLYTVSDNTNRVYKLSMTGTILDVLDYEGEDLEGISFQESKNKLFFVEERQKAIIEYNIQENQYIRHNINYSNSEVNSGMEGITINSDNNTILFINEKKPGILFHLNTDFEILNSYKLSFALDYSGLFYDKELKVLWIISDKSETLNMCSINGELIKRYPLNIDKPEGIAISSINNKLYIVSDSSEKLYIYEKPK